MKNLKIYIITILGSMLLFVPSLVCECSHSNLQPLYNVFSGIGCSGIAAAIMAIFLDYSNNRREQEKLKKAKSLYFKQIYDQLIMVVERILWFNERLQDADFNWGTYNGQGPTDFFCSAHYNNFIVLSGNYSCLLAPIDFDLAFEKEFFVNNDKESQNFGKNDNSAFDQFLNREINTLLFNIINIKESEYYLNQNIEQKFKDIIYFLLNDSLIESYMKTFDKIELDKLEKYNQNGILEYLVKLSLILTYDRIS